MDQDFREISSRSRSRVPGLIGQVLPFLFAALHDAWWKWSGLFIGGTLKRTVSIRRIEGAICS